MDKTIKSGTFANNSFTHFDGSHSHKASFHKQSFVMTHNGRKSFSLNDTQPLSLTLDFHPKIILLKIKLLFYLRS